MRLRIATPSDLPAVLALPADEDAVTDPAPIVVGEAHEKAFAGITADARHAILVLDADGTVAGCPQATCMPGLGRGGAERTGRWRTVPRPPASRGSAGAVPSGR